MQKNKWEKRKEKKEKDGKLKVQNEMVKIA